jgi:subtilisin family serine protease
MNPTSDGSTHTRFWLLLAFLVLVFGTRGAEPGAPRIKSARNHPTQILARYRDDVASAKAKLLLATEGLAEKRRFPGMPGLVLLDVRDEGPGGSAASSAGAQQTALTKRIARLQASGLFRYVEPDFIQTANATPSDASFTDGSLWGLRNDGGSGGVIGADIDAERAWDLTTGSTNVLVAVIDTGIRYTHRDLASQMWRNPGEIAGNGIDDDQDGYVDNVFGINAINGSGDPWDEDDHGTHCAGTIGAAANDGNPHVGVAWNVRLMACKFLGPDGGTTSDAIRCLNFAVSRGARIVSNSWGGGAFSQALFDAIADARDHGVLFVAAAGNESSDNDGAPHYPSNYSLENIVSVAALDRQDKLADFSNYGAQTVDLGAPGVAISSSTSGSDTEYKLFNGTSMAAPHVSGVAALVLARFPDISLSGLRDRLIGTVVPVPALQGRTFTGGRLNAYHAVNAVPDGTLELGLAAMGGELIGGRRGGIQVRVTDLFKVIDATVTGSGIGFPNLVFHDDGVAPDAAAQDGVYSVGIDVPLDRTQLSVAVNVSAEGKQSGTASASFDIVLPPSNDRFVDRAVRTGNTFTVTTSTRGAGKDPGEPAHAGNSGGRSVWWSWTSPSNGLVTLNTEGSDFDTTLAVYVGSEVDALTRIESNDDSGDGSGGVTSRVIFNAVEGNIYQLAVDGFDGQSGGLKLELNLSEPTVPPVNDAFAERALVAGVDAEVTAATLGASRESGEPQHANNPGGRSVWWTWTAPMTGTVVMSTDGSDFDTLLAVYEGDSLATLRRVASDDDSGEGSQSRLSFLASAGSQYQIAVDGFGGDGGSARLRIAQSNLNPVPANDGFASRARLSGTAPVATGDNIEASKEAGEPSHGGNAGGRSVWWTWTLPSSGVVVLETTGSTFDTLLAVYTGTNLNQLTLVAENDQSSQGGNTSRVSFSGVAGTTYQIAVDGSNQGFGAANGAIELSGRVGEVPAAPLNDRFALRSALTGRALVINTANTGATAEPGEPRHAGLPGGSSIWWTWTAPADLLLTLNTGGSRLDTLLAVYTGASLNTLTLVASNDDGPGPSDRTSWLRVNVRAGTTYQIAVDGYQGASGTVRLVLQTAPPTVAPVNDDFANRTILTGNSTNVVATNVGASKQPGEPEHADGIGGASVWWTWTPAVSGAVTLHTASSGFDTLLAVYRGGSLGALIPVASNDDDGDLLTSRVRFTVTAGTSYQIAVDGYDGASGSLRLNLLLVVPSNDSFVNASVLQGLSVTARASSVGASAEPLEPSHAGNIASRSVWWRWTAPASGPATITTAGSSFDTVLAVYSGTAVGGLTEVASNDDNGASPQSRVVFQAFAGREYRIAVDGYLSASGAVVLGIGLQPITQPPPNDGFANAIVLAGQLVTVQGNNFAATKEPSEPNHAGNPGGGSVWWRWTAAGSGPVSIATTGSEIDTLLAVYTGTSMGGLTAVASNNDSGGSLQSRVFFEAVGGREYRIAVDGFGGAAGGVTVVLQHTLVPAPPNDDFANAIAISGLNLTTQGINTGASREPGEPNHARAGGGQSVWWRWTAPETTLVTVFTAGSQMDTTLAVYTGSEVSALVLVGGNDNRAPTGSSSAVTFKAIQGTSYSIAVEGVTRLSGNVNLGLLSFADAADSESLPWDDSGSTARWESQRESSHDAVDALVSGLVEDGQSSTVATSVTGPGTLGFWWRVSSQSGSDFLRVLLDGVAVSSISGDSTWALVEVPIPEGLHVITWSYSKDASGRAGADAGWVDQLTFNPQGIPPTVVQGPRSQTVYAGASVNLGVRVSGSEPMSFEWHRNGQPLPGRTSSSLTLANIQSSDTGDYTVTVSNAFGSATSEPAHLALHSTLQAVLETADGVKGSRFQFSVAIEAGCDYRIQSSADLRVWTDLHRFLSTGTTYEFTDPLLPERTFHFYRVVSP